MKPLVIGEAPGARAGDALSSYESKLPALARMERINLLGEYPGRKGRGASFDVDEARKRAEIIWALTSAASRPLVLMGVRVAHSFGIPRGRYEFCKWFVHNARDVAVIPHPSGVNTWWNDETNRERAKTFLEEASR